MLTSSERDETIEKLRKEIALFLPQFLQKNWEEMLILSCNIQGLNTILPGGGLPRGEFVEIVGSKSSGKTTLLFKILSGLDKQEIAYLDFSGTFYPPSAQINGIDLKRVLILKPKNIQVGLRAGELLLRNRAIDIAVFDFVGTKDTIPKALLLRLKKNIRQAQGIGIFLREPNSTKVKRNQVAIYLRVEKRNEKVLVKTEKNLFEKEDRSVELVLNE
jgi:energy-coupling factor transporter ATP-binding protein EcfA2